MKPNDYAVVVGGSTMPVWLPELNAWVALIVGAVYLLPSHQTLAITITGA